MADSKKLRASQVETLPEGRHSDGEGLYLYVKGGSRLWVYRYTDANRKRREMSLGPAGKPPARIPLSEARETRDELKQSLRKGKNPIGRADNDRSFGAVLERHVENGTFGPRWREPLDLYITPHLKHRDTAELKARDITALVRPIWSKKPAMARKVLQRAIAVTETAEALFEDEVVAVNRRTARKQLPAGSPKAQHIPAMPWDDVPAFYASLTQTISSQAMRLLILTASRTTPVRLARVEQFDGDVWTIPAESMKTRKEFRIPLSKEAQRVVAEVTPLARNGFLFCSYTGKPLHQMTLCNMMARQKSPYRPHGFRSAFRDWAEVTDVPWKLAETALAHTIGSEVERAYRRDDLLEERRAVMDRWADHVTAKGLEG